MQLFTIGYEGFTSQDFIETLNQADVEIIVDVRELPLSRKKGFSKNSLKDNLQKYNINYVHMRNLGCPRDIRHDYRDDKDWSRYTVRFLEYLSTQDETMKSLNEQVKFHRCCLLCFEADFEMCHRSFIADRLKYLWLPSLDIQHLSITQKDLAAEPQMHL